MDPGLAQAVHLVGSDGYGHEGVAVARLALLAIAHQHASLKSSPPRQDVLQRERCQPRCVPPSTHVVVAVRARPEP
eukprot:12237911-Heterocapsa_arctica.AAC.1